MTDVTEFIRARLDEWEQEAHRNWTMREGTGLRGFGPVDEGYYMVETSGGQRIMTYAEFNAEYMDPDPDTERLAQVAAMRAVVDYVEYELEDHGCGNPYWYDTALMPILRHLAAIWSSHPDYDPAWAPDTQT